MANCGRLWDSLRYGEHIYLSFPTVLLINKTKFPNPCHALKNSIAVKELTSVAINLPIVISAIRKSFYLISF